MEETSILIQKITGWWFQIFFIFHPYLGKWSNLTDIFQMGWFNHQPDKEDFSIQHCFTSLEPRLSKTRSRQGVEPSSTLQAWKRWTAEMVISWAVDQPTHNKPKAGFKYVWCSSLCEQVWFNFLHVNLLRRDPPPAVRASHLGSHVCPRIVAHQNPGWLGYIGDYTTQLYRDYNDPV